MTCPICNKDHDAPCPKLPDGLEYMAAHSEEARP